MMGFHSFLRHCHIRKQNLNRHLTLTTMHKKPFLTFRALLTIPKQTTTFRHHYFSIPMSSSLIGPPELRDTYSLTPKLNISSGPSNPFIDAMVSKFNKSTKLNQHPSPLRGWTENGADTYLSACNPCLDFFFHVVPDTLKESIEERLVAAWDHDPLTTLKLICNLRGVQGTGKSNKEGFYTAALWLHGCHPKTLACNLEPLLKFGYFKDFPEILYRILQGHEIRETQKSEWNESKGRKTRGSRRDPLKVGREKKQAVTRRELIEKASLEWMKKKISLGMKALTRYVHDPDYRFLHERVSDLFSSHLKRDMEFLTSNETNQISLAAKWCSFFDKATLICESIAKKLFPRESFLEYQGIEEAHYAYRVRDRLRKEVLVPLQKTLQLPEVYMGARAWDSLPYNRVASVAMKSYKEIFLKHDSERFQQYLEDAKLGKMTIAAGALLPHEIIGELNGGDSGQVAELQWRRMVEDLKKKGSLTNCMAICDVSGSMTGTPMEVSVALGLLVSELSEEPWKGKLITFSQNPELQLVEGDDLRSKTDFVRRMDWGMNTDFQKVFDLILNVAVEGSLKPEEMIKRVFMFSDMEFDQARKDNGLRYYGFGMYGEADACEGIWETDYGAIVRMYEEKGYGEVVPEIVFWNLRDSRSTPVMENEKGVALVSGFSKNMIKVFLNNDGEISPMIVMEAAIAGEEYQKLVVID